MSIGESLASKGTHHREMNWRFHEISFALFHTDHEDEPFGSSQLKTASHAFPKIALIEPHLFRTGTPWAVSGKGVSDQAFQILIVHCYPFCLLKISSSKNVVFLDTLQ
ncbi:hypothetical protein M1413_02415 [Patescibacteria group bacterium]|jgi:hypothetical protein|nr:hypothetical protein [Patescibacteria group bacterium]